MQSDASTVKDYLAGLPEDRRAAIAAVRKTIRHNLPKGYEEGMQYGHIGYYVPHKIYPAGYHCDPRQPLPFAGLASQKNHLAVYLMCIYGSTDQQAWFQAEWAKTGKKLDMGKSCIRFKTLSDLPLELIGQAIARVPVETFIAYYEAAVKPAGKASAQPKPGSAKKKTAKKTPAKKPVAKSATKKSPRKTPSKPRQ